MYELLEEQNKEMNRDKDLERSDEIKSGTEKSRGRRGEEKEDEKKTRP